MVISKSKMKCYYFARLSGQGRRHSFEAEANPDDSDNTVFVRSRLKAKQTCKQTKRQHAISYVQPV